MAPPPQSRPSRRSAPASRVYHSSPAPQQVTFPARRRSVKTYGRAASSSAAAARSLRQQTLTQIDYVQPQPLDLYIDDDDDDDLERMKDEDQPRKRRRTMGDVPSSTASSSFHTQTLTQFLSENGDGEDERKELLIGDSEDDDDLDLSVGLDNERKQNESPLKAESQASSMIPQTPAHKRTKEEIPSSQPSPFTPMLERYSIAPDRSPLKGKSTNVEAPPPTAETLNKRPRTLVVQDSYGTVNGGLSSDNGSQMFGWSPQKENRPPNVDPDRSLVLGLDDINEEPVKEQEYADETDEEVTRDGEIPDSDDEFDMFDPTPQKDKSDTRASAGRGTPTPLPRPHQTQQASDPMTGIGAPSTPGLPSQRQSSPIPTQRPHRNPTPEADAEDEDAEFLPPSPSPVRTQSVKSRSSFIEKETPLSSPQKTSPVKGPQPASSPRRTQYYTQGVESQRVPLEVIRDMGPQTDRSDIIISIHPEHVERIANGTKNHEFRNYRIPPTVGRIWIYVTKPICELRYMAMISEAKQPGEIDDEKGVGNAEFNSGKMSKFAYELQQVYQLNNPVSIEKMKDNGWVEAPPQKYIYVPPAVVGQLMGNLRCALLFDEHPQTDVGISISQEVEMQIRSDISHATQLLSSDGIEMVPSSQEPTPRGKGSHSKPESFAKPMLPATKTRPATRSQATPTKLNNDHNFVRPSQATTVSEVSSPVPSPARSSGPRRPPPCSSMPSFPEEDDVDESPIGLRLPPGQQFSLGSSQVLLPDSLINDDDVRRPPVEWESDGEGES